MATNKNIKINLDYSNFTGGIKECNSKMQILTEQFKLQKAALGDNADKVDKLTLTQSMLTEKIRLQEQIVEQAKEKFKALSESESATQRQVDAAQKAMIKQQTALQEMNNELDGTNTKLQQLSTSEEGLSTNASNASKSSEGFAQSLANTITSISAISGALQSVVSTITSTIRTSASMVDNINTMSTVYGVSASTIEAWTATAGLSDVSVQTLGSSLAKLTRSMSSAQSGTESYAQVFNQLGINIEDSNGHLRDSEDVFYDLIDALGSMDSEAERDAAAMTLLGRSAQELNPIITMGSAAFKEMQANAVDIIPEAFAQDLQDAMNAMDTLDAAMTEGSNILSAMMAPAFTKLAEAATNADPGLLTLVAGIKMVISIGSALTPILTMISTHNASVAASAIAAAAAEGTDAAAKQVDAASTTVATAANTGFLTSLIAVGTEMAPLILSMAGFIATIAAVAMAIAAIINAIASLANAIEKIIELFDKSSQASDKAANSMNKYGDAASRVGSSSSNASASTAYMATGSTAGGAGGWTWVGEQGAELVNLPYGSTVYNHEESRSMSTTSKTNNFYVTIDAQNVNDFNKVVKVFSGLGQSMNRGGLVNG